MKHYILAIDQGTTSTRSMVFTATGTVVSSAQQEFTQYFPEPNQVEHDPDDIIESVINTCKQAISDAAINPEQLAAIGMTNQRETTVIWHKQTGKPIHNAIVWQDRRTTDYCQSLRDDGWMDTIQQKTGLVIDPYFSATKIKWLLDQYDPDRQQATQGELLFGTIDTFVLWHLTGGESYATDVTNASRTLLFNISTMSWDEELLTLFNIPREMLPEVKDCDANFGTTKAAICGVSAPVNGIAGDQHAAVVGQACFHKGMLKSTYGTGCFMMLNTGETIHPSKHRLLTTVAYRLKGKTCYALEGSIFMAGATIQWLRDNLGLIQHASDTEALAKDANPNSQVVMVPAFVGLGAPYWAANALASITGMGRGTGKAEIAAAALESIAFQTRDLVEAMQADMQSPVNLLRVDGGMVTNTWFDQCLANTLNAQIDIPEVTETTALGAAYIAALGVGLIESTEAIEQQWQCASTFSADKALNAMRDKYPLWQTAVSRVVSSQ